MAPILDDNSIDAVWLRMIRDIMDHGQDKSPRGQRTRELLHHHVIVDMTRPVLTILERRLGYRFLCAEAAWILSGDDRVETIAPYSKSIASYSDDGVRFFGAYGPKFIDQVSYVVSTLQRDPSSRQAVINIWRENPPSTHDVPCTLSYQFLIRDERLHLIVTMRSNDAYLGFVYDAFSASAIAGFVLLSLGMDGLRLGNLYHTAGSRHLYERDWDKVIDCLAGMTQGFSYTPFDPVAFPSAKDLVSHLWALARHDSLRHSFLKELLEEETQEWLKLNQA